MDIEKISAFLHKLANAKIITLILILGVSGFFVYKNFEFITEITFKVERPNDLTKQSPAKDERYKYTNITINATLTPLQFDIPSYFLVEVTNSGPAVATNIETLIDLGRSKITSLDIKPKDRCSISSGNIDSSEPIRVVCKTLNVGESLYIYSLLSEATYRNILVSSPSLSQSVSETKIESLSGNKTNVTFKDVVIFILESIAVIALFFIGYFTLSSTYRFLSRIFGIK